MDNWFLNLETKGFICIKKKKCNIEAEQEGVEEISFYVIKKMHFI